MTTDKPSSEGGWHPDRQAVVIIHGIGEQRPMQTLRGFADAVLGVLRNRRSRFYNKPDMLSDTFELRKLVSHRGNPRADLFELYWAHRMPIATWSRIAAWFQTLMLRPRADLEPQIRPIWWMCWTLAPIAVLLLLAGAVFWICPGLAPSWWPSGGQTPLPLLLGIALLGVQGVVLSYVGDAAIYLSAHPRTVAARQEIRAAGVALLEKLHAGGEYGRIVLVGHSLGSVIGYDLITQLWQRYNERHAAPAQPDQTALHALEAAIAGEEAMDTAQWHAAIHRLWHEQRKLGNPWLITDFVTLGSPLTHGKLLLADKEATFRRKQDERELPISPPMPERKREISYEVHYTTAAGAPQTLYMLHHAAPFAVVRWTNLYFPCRGVFTGDVVGGPVAPGFGPAVRDVPVATRIWGGLLAHTHYWTRDPRDKGQSGEPVPALREALGLWTTGGDED